MTLLILLIYVYFSSPESGPILPCIFNKITGYYCPGCGMTRSINSVLHINIKEAITYNIMIIIIPILVIFYLVGIYMNNESMKDIIIYLLLIILIVYGILRNTEKFGFLAPKQL